MAHERTEAAEFALREAMVRASAGELARRRWSGTTKAERCRAMEKVRSARSYDAEKRAAIGAKLAAARKAKRAERERSFQELADKARAAAKVVS